MAFLATALARDRDSLAGRRLLTSWLRPSAIARALWLAVAALHVWLVLRRVTSGDWASLMDYLRAALCLAGVGYASLKFWQIATVFDCGPRRALIFGLVLLLGHWLISPSAHEMPAPGAAPSTLTLVLATMPSLGIALLGALLLGLAARQLGRPSRRRRVRLAPAIVHWLAPLKPFACFESPSLFRRPPPAHA